MKSSEITGYLGLLMLVLGIILLLTGCAYQRYDTCTTVNVPKDGSFSLPKGGALVRVEVKDNTGSVEKSTPFDFLRGLGQGSAVSAAPGATATQSGSPTQDNSGLDTTKDTKSTKAEAPGAAVPGAVPEKFTAEETTKEDTGQK